MPKASQSNAVNCVKGEIHNVLSMMRVNQRWASGARFQREVPLHSESPLLRNFKTLHQDLESCTDLNDFDTLNYLEPFLQILESEHASGIITGVAVSSLNKFLLYELLTAESPRAKEAINRIASAVSRCRFEETHRDTDEMVLMKLLELLEYCLRCNAGPLICDANVWQMVQTCYRISQQPRSSIHLCHTAENTLAHLVLTVFNRITELQDHGSPGPYGIPILEQIVRFLSSLIDAKQNDESTRILGLSLINIVLETGGPGLGAHPTLVSVMQADLSKYLLQNSESNDLSILSVTLRVVFNLFNSIKDHLKVQLEVFFTSVHMRIIDSPSCSDEQKELAMESLVEFCREPALMLDLYVNYDCDVHCTNLFEVLCKTLSRLAKSPTGRLNVLNLLALEGLLAVIDAIARRCQYDPKKEMIKDLKGADLAQFALPKGPISPMSSATDVMQLVINSNNSESESDSDIPIDWLHSAREKTAEVMQQRKKTKKRLMLAAEKFNTDRKGWISYAQQLGLLPTPIEPDAVARFLLHTPGLNKTRVGDYLSEGPPDKYPFNEQVRDAYVSLFDFTGKQIAEALRIFLEKFRLPGEAQKIDRMMETFSKSLFDQNPDGPFANADTAFILSFSIIMLNTDLHNDQIAKKMTLEEFIRNNRGINDNKDLPIEYLTELYNEIRDNEIKMQHDVAELATDSNTAVLQWDGVLKRSQNVVGASFTSNALIKSMRAGLYERAMFSIIADKTIASISIAFEQTSDHTTMEKAIEGLHNCAKIAVYFDLVEVLDHMIIALCKYFLRFASAVLSGEVVLPNKSESSEEDEEEEEEDIKPMSREEMLAVRALVALELVFKLVNQYGSYFRQAWREVVECILMLNELDVLPTSIVEMDDFVDARGVPLESATAKTIEQVTTAPPNAGMSGRVRERSRRRAERRAAAKARAMAHAGSSAPPPNSSGLWGSISSLLWADDEDDDDASAAVNELLIQYVNRCGLERETWAKLCKHLSSDALTELIRAFIMARDPLRSTTQHTANSVDPMLQENAVLAVELITNMVLANQHRLVELWPLMHSYFERILQSTAPDLRMNLLIERIMVSLLRVCIRLLHERQLSSLLMNSLQLLHGLSPVIAAVLSERLALGLLTLLKANAMYMQDKETWSVMFELLRMCSEYPNGRSNAWEALKFLVESGNVTETNFELWIQMIHRYLNGFEGLSNNDVIAAHALKLLRALATSVATSPVGENEGQDVTKLNERWFSIVELVFSKVKIDRIPVVRSAWDTLHSLVVLPGPIITPATWKRCFDEILFHLSDHIRENLWQDPEEARLRCSGMLSKAFLHNVTKLADMPNFHLLWLNVLRRLAVDLKPSDHSDSILFETTLQALNNILMVMSSEGIFDKVSEQSNQDVLELTWAVLDAINPQVREQIYVKPEKTDLNEDLQRSQDG